MQWVIVLSPIWIFVISAFIVLVRLRGSYNFGDALSESEPIRDQNGAVISDDDGKPLLSRSSSRLVALLTGLAALGIAIGVSSSVLYYVIILVPPNAVVAAIEAGKEVSIPVPDFKNLTTILLVLGIGVVPYGANRLGRGLQGAGQNDSQRIASSGASPN